MRRGDRSIYIQAKDKEVLLHVRELHKEKAGALDGLRELKLLSVSISSPNMDGMPKTHGDKDKHAQILARIEKQEQSIAAIDRKIRKAQTAARRALKTQAGSFRIFCETYYVDGLPFDVAQAQSGLRRSRCYDYIKAVKGSDG